MRPGLLLALAPLAVALALPGCQAGQRAAGQGQAAPPAPAEAPVAAPEPAAPAPAPERDGPVAPGVEVRHLSVASDGLETRVAAVFADPDQVRLRVWAELPQARWSTAAEVARATGAAAVINGGYFDEAHRPMGLIIAAGRRLNRLRAADWGVFLVRDGVPGLVHTRNLASTTGLDEAIQCGPRLVVDGRPTKLKPSAPTARSAVGLDAQGRVVLAAAPGLGLSLSEFAGLLARPAAEGGAGCVQALNLDGGGSTQLEVPGRVSLTGLWPMPTFLVVGARTPAGASPPAAPR